MNPYSGNRVPGTTVFFTVRLRERGCSLLTDHIAAFGAAIHHTRSRRPFHVDAWVVLPDHAHAIWTMPAGDDNGAERWRVAKIAFSKSLHKCGLATDLAIWERQFRSCLVADDAQYRALVDYVHDNPVRHGLCAGAEDWRWSSLHRFLAAGLGRPMKKGPAGPLGDSGNQA